MYVILAGVILWLRLKAEACGGDPIDILGQTQQSQSAQPSYMPSQSAQPSYGPGLSNQPVYQPGQTTMMTLPDGRQRPVRTYSYVAPPIGSSDTDYTPQSFTSTAPTRSQQADPFSAFQSRQGSQGDQFSWPGSTTSYSQKPVVGRTASWSYPAPERSDSWRQPDTRASSPWDQSQARASSPWDQSQVRDSGSLQESGVSDDYPSRQSQGNLGRGGLRLTTANSWRSQPQGVPERDVLQTSGPVSFPPPGGFGQGRSSTPALVSSQPQGYDRGTWRSSENGDRASGMSLPSQSPATSNRPTTLSTRRPVQSNQRARIQGNPPHLYLPANQVSSKFHNPGDENPDRWVTPNPRLDTLPHSVIIPMMMEGGMFYGEMTVGTAHPGYPEQKMKVEFDTGSTGLWLLTTESCRRQRCVQNAKKFEPSQSTTYRQGETRLKTRYGSGEVEGVFSEDTVTIGEGGNILVINNQKIGQAQSFRGVFERFDIICGMSLTSPPMMRGEPHSLLYMMTKQYGTTLPFGFYANKYNPERSKMIFGEGYQQFIEGELNSHQVHPIPHGQIGEFIDGWYVKVEGWMVEAPRAAAIELPINTEMFALVDSGASTFVGPDDMIKQLNQYIFQFATFTVTQDYSFPCDTDTEKVYMELPDVSIFIDGIKYTLAPYQYIGNQFGRCRALFEGRVDENKIIIGVQLMNKYFTRFDHSRKLVQFALAKQDFDHPKGQWHQQLERQRWGGAESASARPPTYSDPTRRNSQDGRGAVPFSAAGDREIWSQRVDEETGDRHRMKLVQSPSGMYSVDIGSQQPGAMQTALSTPANGRFSTYRNPNGPNGQYGGSAVPLSSAGGDDIWSHQVDQKTGQLSPMKLIRLPTGEYTVDTGSQPPRSTISALSGARAGVAPSWAVSRPTALSQGDGPATATAKTDPSWVTEDNQERYEQAKGFANNDWQKMTISDIFGGGQGGSAQSGGASAHEPVYEAMTVKKTLPSTRVDIPLRMVGSDYYGVVTVGTPSAGAPVQQFTVLFDTGSPQFVLNTKYGHSPYNPALSSTHKTQQIPMETTYGSGSFQGHWAYDVVKLGSGEDAIVLEDQGFVEVTSSTNLFEDYDAIFGLAIIDKNEIRDEPDPPLNKMKAQFNTVPIFGIYFGKTDKEQSMLVFGDSGDSDFAVSGFKTHSLVQGHSTGKNIAYGWNVQLDSIEVGNGVVNVQATPKANLDSGTTAIAGPTALIRDIQQKIFASWPSYDRATFSFPCTDEGVYDVYLAMPDVTFVMSGQRYTLRPFDYMYIEDSNCKAGFVGMDIDEIILGRMFLTKYYTKFDYMNKQVHIATAKQSQNDEAFDQMLQLYKKYKQRQG